jgi:hypothetical protein
MQHRLARSENSSIEFFKAKSAPQVCKFRGIAPPEIAEQDVRSEAILGGPG